VPGNIVGKALVKEILSVPVEGGDVFVYQVENKSNALFGNSFYIATFDDTASEGVWGVGDTIMNALKDAERNWNREEGDYGNPFREAREALALGILEKTHVEDLTGEVTVKEIGKVNVGDDTVSVYEIKNNDENLLFHDFYIATLNTLGYEAIWGEGDTPDSALEDAEINWSIKNPVYSNPFKKAIEILKENKERNILNNY